MNIHRVYFMTDGRENANIHSVRIRFWKLLNAAVVQRWIGIGEIELSMLVVNWH